MRTYIDRIPYQGIACWPGDTSFEHQENTWETVRVGAVTMSLHTGTHIDASRHLVSKSGSVDDIPDSTLCGPATVIDARGREALSADLFAAVSTPRVLVRTDAWLDSSSFPMSFPLLTPDAATLLARRGIVLFGIDLPSVDAVDSKNLPIHHILMNAEITICEGLAFDNAKVSAGDVELTIVPFVFKGADAAPVRAWIENISR
ncbi:MAG: cyclase family protein [Armatimonadota bacterium]